MADNVFTQIVDLLFKTPEGAVSATVDSIDNLGTSMINLASKAGPVKDVISALWTGLAQSGDVVTKQWQITSGAFEKLTREGATVLGTSEAVLTTIGVSAAGSLKTMAIAAETAGNVLDVALSPALVGTVGTLLVANAALNKVTEVMALAGAAAAEYAANMDMVNASLARTGKNADIVTQHFSKAAEASVYRKLGEEFSSVASAFDELGSTFSLIGTSITSKISDVIIQASKISGVSRFFDSISSRLKDINKNIYEFSNPDVVRNMVASLGETVVTTEGLTKAFSELSATSGASFSEISQMYRKLADETGKPIAAVNTLKAALVISEKTGFGDFRELASIFTTLSTGGTLAESTMNKFGLSLVNAAGDASTSVDTMNELIAKFKQAGISIPKDVAAALDALVSPEAQRNALKQRIDSLRAFRKLSADEELAILKDSATIRTGSARADAQAISAYYDGISRATDALKEKQIGFLNASNAARKATTGVKPDELKAVSDAEEAAFLQRAKLLAISRDDRQKYYNEGLALASNELERRKALDNDYFASEQALRKRSLEAQVTAGKGGGINAAGALEQQRLDIINANIAANEQMFAGAIKGTARYNEALTNQITLQEEAVAVTQESIVKYQQLAQETRSLATELQGFQDSSIISTFNLEEEQHASRMEFIQAEIDKNKENFDLYSRGKADQVREELGFNQKVIAFRNTVASISDKMLTSSTQKLREQQIYQDRLLQNLSKSGSFSSSAIDPFQKFLISQVKDSFEGTIASGRAARGDEELIKANQSVVEQLKKVGLAGINTPGFDIQGEVNAILQGFSTSQRTVLKEAANVGLKEQGALPQSDKDKQAQLIADLKNITQVAAAEYTKNQQNNETARKALSDSVDTLTKSLPSLDASVKGLADKQQENNRLFDKFMAELSAVTQAENTLSVLPTSLREALSEFKSSLDSVDMSKPITDAMQVKLAAFADELNKQDFKAFINGMNSANSKFIVDHAAALKSVLDGFQNRGKEPEKGAVPTVETVARNEQNIGIVNVGLTEAQLADALKKARAQDSIDTFSAIASTRMGF